MEIGKNKVHYSYIILGSLYFLIKLVCYIMEFVCLMGLVYGLIATIFAVSIGIFALVEYKNAKRIISHWGAVIIPLIILSYTHILLITELYKQGTDMFPTEKLVIFMIFEALAVLQIILAASMFKRVIYKIHQ